MTQNVLLSAQNLAVAYGGIHAVKQADLYIQAGELVAIIGANGAGKTSTIKALCGLLPLAAGQVEYLGRPINQYRPHDLVTHGLALVPEGRGIFGRLSVEENLDMGAYRRRDNDGIKADLGRIYELFPRLFERRKQAAGTLSGGEQQMVAMGRAMMSRPNLLFLDEPSMGLAPLMVQKIFDTIKLIASEGVTLLLVEQNAKLALQASHRGYVMESGRITLADEATALLSNEAVRKAYLGD